MNDNKMAGTQTIGDFFRSAVKQMMDGDEDQVDVSFSLPIDGKKFHVTFELTLTAFEEEQA